MMKKTFFNKNENWDLKLFYTIYIENNIKIIKFIGETDRADTGKEYLSWICTYCDENCKMPLCDFLLWDVYYQRKCLFDSCNKNYDVELSPQECYNQANKWVKADGDGSLFKKLLDLTENTPCGYYFGY